MALEWYWWVVIGVSVVAVGATAYIILSSRDDEEASVAEEELEHPGPRMWDLRDEADRKQIEDRGVRVPEGRREWITAQAADEETGWEWIIDPSGCSGKIAKFSQSSEAPDWMNGERDGEMPPPPPPRPKKQAKEEEEEDLPEEIDAEEVSDSVYFEILGVKAGECTFRMAYAPSDTFDWETGVSEDDEYDVVEIPIEVVVDAHAP